ncbi:cell wall hydrolase [Sphingomicrobium flavum]|uniref:cell wall hydrolase n=1 Tax=Sphingomicrobium flavum TaxID=1229164 RepID=UPI0021AE073C|nr:cell wall hydrolase [Sphingomicrobium flavum]
MMQLRSFKPTRMEVAALIMALVLGVIALGETRQAPAQAAVSVPLMPVEAKALIDATTGADLVAFEAVGQSAQMINASLPFDRAGLDAARPFAGGGGRDYDRAHLCLTQAIYYEAGFEPKAGRRAVAQVVLNRVRHPAFASSVCGVVYEGARKPVCQFSFTCDGSLERRPQAAAWAEAKQIAREALGGHVEASVGTATHYHADYVAPKWAPKLTKVDKLGAHIFYRWPGSWGRRSAFGQAYRGEPYDPASLRPTRYLGKTITEEIIAAVEPEVPAGPAVARAENDVGGLLDTSKGWTLSIPDPAEASAGAKALERQQQGLQNIAVADTGTASQTGAR